MKKKIFFIFLISIVIVFSIILYLLFNRTPQQVSNKKQINFILTYENQEIESDFVFARFFICYETLIDNSFEDSFFEKEGLEEIRPFFDSFYDSEKNCYWQAHILPVYLDCNNKQCIFSTQLSEEHKLGIYLPDHNRLFISNKIISPSKHKTYSANLTSDGNIEIKKRYSIFNIKIY